MAALRPTLSVYNLDGEVEKTVKTPEVFASPIRPDLVRDVHTNLAKNKRQAYAVVIDAGYQSSAQSWGTGRAVARIPRVPGGGTHRSGQGAFGNMCRGGGMFNPNPVWRRWHRKVNLTKRRHGIVSAVAASGVPALVMARGHRLNELKEYPLVLSDTMQSVNKTRQAVSILEKFGFGEELERIRDSKKIRAGRGKTRNRRYRLRRGPLIIYGEDGGITRAFRNIPGVDLCCVDRLNLLQLAPGGSIGRLIIWTESAMRRLPQLYGNFKAGSQLKKSYRLMRPMITNPDISRLINSDEIQSVLRPMVEAPRRTTMRKNPLKNRSILGRLNPAALRNKKLATLKQTKGSRLREALQKKNPKKTTK